MSPLTYPNKALVIDTLTEVARRVANEANARHPADLATAMSFAIEYGAETFAVLMEKGVPWRIDYTNPNVTPWWQEETDPEEPDE